MSTDAGIFSLEHRLSLARTTRIEHRRLQAQLVRVLARIEVAELARQAQAVALRPRRVALQPQRGLLARVASWFSRRNSSPQLRTQDVPAERAAALMPSLYQVRDEIAQELECVRNAPTAPRLHPFAATIELAEPTRTDDTRPHRTRWG